MTIKTIYECWQKFNDVIIPVGTPQAERDKMREAFYMGAVAFDTATTQIFVASRNGSMRESLLLAKSLLDEINLFNKENKFGPQEEE